MYLVLSALTSIPISLVAGTREIGLEVSADKDFAYLV